MRQGIRAVLFDLDNTLADRDAAFLGWARWFVRERLRITDSTTAEGVVAELFVLDDGGRASKVGLFQELKRRYPHLGQTAEMLVSEFRERLTTHLPPLDPGAARLLDALDEGGLPWGIVSNGSATQLRKVRALGLDARAGCVVISEMIGIRKPASAIFLHAAGTVGADPGEIVFVGDHPEADILGAMGAGMWTAWLRRGQEWPATLVGHEPHHAVDSLEELMWIAGSAEPADHVIEKSAP